jgi:putative membrane protein
MDIENFTHNTPPQLSGEKKTVETAFGNESLAVAFLCLIYFVGLIGFIFNIHPHFVYLTPVNLLISLSIALSFHKKVSFPFILWCLLTIVVGFTVEAIGVNTGKIFGVYQYGEVLGAKIWNTPLSIGVNWLLTTYCSAIVVHYAYPTRTNWFLKSIIAVVIMVSLDVLIEPIAIKTGMWSWADNDIPIQNYIGWFLTGLPLQILFFKFIRTEKNKVAFALLILQFLFFFILNIFLK